MSEPSTTAFCASATASALCVAGVMTGLHFDALLAGFAGGLLALSYLPPMSALQRILNVVGASLAAGYCAPLGAQLLASLPIIPSGVTFELLRLPVAFGVGYLAQGVLLPFLRRFVAGRAEEAVK